MLLLGNMELGIGIIIGLIIGILILLSEKRLEYKNTSITQCITKKVSKPKLSGHIIEDEMTGEDVINLIK